MGGKTQHKVHRGKNKKERKKEMGEKRKKRKAAAVVGVNEQA